MDFKKVLVIGGAGFVGSNLCKRLAQDESVDVYSYDNYFTGSEYNHHQNVNYIKGESFDILKNLKGLNFSHIFHLGEYSRVEQSFHDIDKVFEYNHKPIYEILKFAKNSNAKFIYSGSSTKFGDDGTAAFSSPYALTKKINAEIVKTYSEWFGLDYAITYFYNVYGENEIKDGKYATLIGIYTKLYEEGCKALPVVKPGSQRRNFTHISDIVEGLLVVGKHGHGDDYGIGSDQSYSINDIVNLFKLQIEWLPERKGNRMSSPILSEKTKLLGWEAKCNLEDYIKNIIEL